MFDIENYLFWQENINVIVDEYDDIDMSILQDLSDEDLHGLYDALAIMNNCHTHDGKFDPEYARNNLPYLGQYISGDGWVDDEGLYRLYVPFKNHPIDAIKFPNHCSAAIEAAIAIDNGEIKEEKLNIQMSPEKMSYIKKYNDIYRRMHL